MYANVTIVSLCSHSHSMQGDPDRTTRPGYKGFEFLRPLVVDMTNEDPESRPRMPEVLERFETLIGGLKSTLLRSRCRLKPMYDGDKEPIPATAIIGVIHWYKQLTYVVRKMPAIPRQS